MHRAEFSPRRSPLRHSTLPAVVALAAWMAALILLRAAMVDAAFSPYVRCDHCFFWPSLAHDSVLFALALGLFGTVSWLRGRWLRVIVLVALAALMLIAASDLLVFKALTHRLLWSDALKFVRDLGTVGDIGAQSLQGGARVVAIVMGVAGALIWVLCLVRGVQTRSREVTALVCAGVIALAGWVARGYDPAYVNANISFQNVIEVNLAQSIDAGYSAAFIKKMRATPALAQSCSAGQQRHPNVVLVMVESLSSYHSRRFGGDLDATPQLDALAATGRWFPDFHANGFTTDGGMIALLTGLAPVPVIGRYGSMDAFAGYADRAHSAPALLGRHGYYSAFFTTGDLGFVDKNRWLPVIGFDHFEGSESGFYNGRERGIFGAARDALLFDRFVQWYADERDANRPFFAALLTVTTHPPFMNPETGLADEQAVFREVDAAIAGLHAYLQKLGYFENGILLVTGDHRAMTPLRASEYQREGETAFSRVPLYAWGPSDFANGRIDGKFQHSDLLPSLADLNEATTCHQAGQGLFLRADPMPAQFALHARGMPRDHIDVYANDARGRSIVGSVVLGGDNSRWVGAKPAHWQSIEAAIHLQRATRTGGEANLLDTLIEMRRPL